MRTLYSLIVFSEHWILRNDALNIIFLLALVLYLPVVSLVTLFSNYNFDFKIPHRGITQCQNLSLASIYKTRRYQTQSLSANLSQLSNQICLALLLQLHTYLAISTHSVRVHFYQGIGGRKRGSFPLSRLRQAEV